MVGREPAEVGRLFAGFTAYAEPFRSIVTELGGIRMDPAGPASARPAKGGNA